MSIHEHRQQVRRLLDDSSPTDAPTAYYALFHPAARSALVTRVNGDGRVQGFLGRFQTGIDLFRPLITLACRDAEIAADLMAEALTVGRPSKDNNSISCREKESPLTLSSTSMTPNTLSPAMSGTARIDLQITALLGKTAVEPWIFFYLGDR